MSLIAIAAAGPPAIVALMEIVLLALSAAGDHPRWTADEVNLSEAAAIRDFAEVARLIERGENPGTARPVRQGMVEGPARDLTPLEAAALGERDEIAAYLLEHGARPSRDEWLRLHCHAETSGLDDLAAVLETARPSAIDVRCDGVTPLIAE
jgi:hypothetical protein